MALICTTVDRASTFDGVISGFDVDIYFGVSARAAALPGWHARCEEGDCYEVEDIRFSYGVEPDDASGALTSAEIAGLTLWFHSSAGYARASEASYCEGDLD